MQKTTPHLLLSDTKHELHAEHGSIILLTGPVGSGKSLWLERLAGLAPLPEAVQCTLDGNAWPDKRNSARVRLLSDLQPPIFLGQTVAEELAFGLDIAPSDADMQQVLQTWHLDALESGRNVRSLNRLEATRLALAAMELAAPSIALLDNPTASLPTDAADSLRDDIRAWAKRGKVIVVVACNRWQDWPPWIAQTWCLEEDDALPIAEAAGV